MIMGNALIIIAEDCPTLGVKNGWVFIFENQIWRYFGLVKIAQFGVGLTPSLRRLCIHAIFFRPHVGQRVNTHSVFWESCRKPCQHVTRGCDKRWMTCIHAGVSRSPREHASVPPDKRHCRQGMSEWNGMSEWIFALSLYPRPVL